MEKFENYSLKNNQKKPKNDLDNKDNKIVIKIFDSKKTKTKNKYEEQIQNDRRKIEYVKKTIEENLKIYETGQKSKAKIFDPILEFAKIRLLPKEKRKEAIKDFKKQLIDQRWGWAECQSLIEHLIEVKPDIEKDFLMSKVIKFFQYNYGFCDWQIKKAEHILNTYYQYRESAKKAFEKWTDKFELVKNLTEINFPESERKNFKISLGLMNLIIVTNAENASKIYYQTENPINIKLEDFKVLGFVKPPQFIEGEVLYAIINQSRQPSYDKEGFVTKLHEEQHFKNAIFEKIFFVTRTAANANIFLDLYEEETLKNPENKEYRKFLLKNYALNQLRMALDRTKDEIFAYTKSIAPASLDYKFVTHLFIGKNAAYNYAKKFFNKGLKNDAFYQEFFNNFFKKDYPQIIRKSCRAFLDLVNFIQKQKGEKINALEKARLFLIDKSIIDWPKVVKRFIEAKSA